MSRQTGDRGAKKIWVRILLVVRRNLLSQVINERQGPRSPTCCAVLSVGDAFGWELEVGLQVSFVRDGKGTGVGLHGTVRTKNKV